MHKPYPQPRCSETEWQGRPLLLIEGPFRPFRVSPAKAAVLVDMVEDLRGFAEKYKHFVKRYGKKTPDRIPTPEEMAIIAKYVQDPHRLENLTAQPLTVEQK